MDLRQTRQAGLAATAMLFAMSIACGPPPAPHNQPVTSGSATATASTTAAPVDPFAVQGELVGEKLPAAMPVLPLRQQTLPSFATARLVM